MRIALDQQKEFAELLVKRLSAVIGDELVTALLTAEHKPPKPRSMRSANAY